MNNNRISLYDTTLRDGTEGEGIALSCDDKLKIARRLDEFGMAYIEGGWPGSNPKDMEFFDRAQTELTLRNAKVAAFGSTCKADVDPADDQQAQEEHPLHGRTSSAPARRRISSAVRTWSAGHVTSTPNRSAVKRGS